MTDTRTGPVIVTARGPMLCAVIMDGENRGLPVALAMAIACGHISRAEVERRGWRYVEGTDAFAAEVSA